MRNRQRFVRQRHADDLYQVLKDLTAMAKLAAPITALNTYQAAVRNADELLNKIDEESKEDVGHEQKA